MKLSITLGFIFWSTFVLAQYTYDISDEYPYGQPNPKAPKSIKDFDAMMGTCYCKSTTRNSDGSWNAAEDMLWKWRYIMNGMAVLDETLKADGAHSGSIRQFVPDKGIWYVHWFSATTPSSRFTVYEGKKVGNRITLYQDQTAPNGLAGYYKLTYYDISTSGYKWIGEWVDKDETIAYPTWKIECMRKE